MLRAAFQAGCKAGHFSEVRALRPAPAAPQRHAPQHRLSEEIMKIRPLYDRVVVTRIAEEEKTKGGIIIPDTAKEKPVEGKVLAVGTGRVLEDGSVRKLDISVGDRVLFGKYSGTEVNINGEEHLILREDDILGVVEK
jgi:chaperonin GroES